MKVKVKVEFSREDVRRLLIEETERRVGNAPEGTKYKASAGYSYIPTCEVESVEIEPEEVKKEDGDEGWMWKTVSL